MNFTVHFLFSLTQEDYSGGVELLSFTAVSTKLLSLVSGTLRAELAQQILVRLHDVSLLLFTVFLYTVHVA